MVEMRGSMSRSVQIQARVGPDGVLTLRVPLTPSEANVEVIVTMQPKSRPAQRSGASDWPTGYFEKTYGSLANGQLSIPEDPVPTSQDI